MRFIGRELRDFTLHYLLCAFLTSTVCHATFKTQFKDDLVVCT